MKKPSCSGSVTVRGANCWKKGSNSGFHGVEKIDVEKIFEVKTVYKELKMSKVLRATQ